MCDTTWFYKRIWGVTAGNIGSLMIDPENISNMGRGLTSWNECVDDFDTDLFASQIAKAGAGYVIFTLNQQGRFMSAPNATFDNITGYFPGEACSETDIVEKLYDSLSKYNIDLLLCVSCDGPSRDPIARTAFGGISCGEPKPYVTTEFVKKWALVITEYSQRYGKKIKGWWMDGCYYNIGYTDAKLKMIADACRTGNPDAIVSSNLHGLTDEYSAIIDHVRTGCPSDDFAFGELWMYKDLPYAPFVGHCRWHVWSWFSSPYTLRDEHFKKIEYTPEYLRDYVQSVHDLGGVVTMGIFCYRDGRLFESSSDLISLLNEIR